VTDLRLGRLDGIALLRSLRAELPDAQVVVVTAFGSLDTAVEAIRAGAFDYVSKPFRMEEICATVRRALEAHSDGAAPGPDADADTARILGRSAAMTSVFTAIARVASLKTSVLIQGETGTGKELVARAIHEAGARSDGPYVTVNCASLPEGVLESELFGHVKGAFTGAAADRKGLFEAADGGTILLDEIGDMPLGVQAKLLRVLESGEVRPVGSTDARTVDVRVLAATHRDLLRAVADGTFRQDLLFRLNAVTIPIPPLRERAGDVRLLTTHFLRHHARAAGRPHAPEVTPAALARMEAYAWPGNVRELSHVIERAIALGPGPRLDVADLPPHMHTETGRAAEPPSSERLDDVEKAHILAVLKNTGGNRARAAAILGIDRKTLYRKLLRYGLQERDEPEA
jgi:DNA-binding NtrC family response regulator